MCQIISNGHVMLVTFTVLFNVCFSSFAFFFIQKYKDLAQSQHHLRYARPKLEYNTVVWSPFLHKDSTLVQSVQKKFTRHICIRCKIGLNSYSDRLSKLNINSLEYRRLAFDLILMFKSKYVITCVI